VRVVVRRLGVPVWDGEIPAVPRIGERVVVHAAPPLFVDRVTWSLPMASETEVIIYVDAEPLSMYGDGAPLRDERKEKLPELQPNITGRKRR
jgi:hypothetical protein